MQAPRKPFIYAGVGALLLLAWNKRNYLLPDGRIADKVGLRGKGYPILFADTRLVGAHPLLQRFRAEWAKDGPFPLMIPRGSGTDRTEADVAANAASGASNATSLRDTPHGRKAATDFYPALVIPGLSVVRNIYLAEPPRGGSVAAHLIRPDLFEIIGRRAEAVGLEWGGRWVNKYGFGKYGDAGHVQVPNWRSLPFPAV